MIDKKSDILDAGRELFHSKGFKHTKVSDITKIAGVGAGTFYNYYSSKEELFLEIYIRESEDIKRSIVEAIDMNDDPITIVTKFVTQNISAMNSNPILKELYNRDLFSKLKQFFYEHGGFENNDLSDELISAIFNSIVYIEIHKSEIGAQYFPQILHYITEFIIKGLRLNKGRDQSEKKG